MVKVSALYVRQDSIYKQLGIDAWDIDRDARGYPGPGPVICHPPCRSWGRLAHFSNPRPDEKELARTAVKQVREWGGILEHPRSSRLWIDQQLPNPGSIDEFGGYTLFVNQSWWGHKAEKGTLLYIVGCSQKDLPPIPISFDAIQYTVASKIKKKSGRLVKKEITRKEREITPILFAEWLIKVAEKCKAL